VDTGVQSGKKSNTPIEFGCDLTEFALLGTATLRGTARPAHRGGEVARPELFLGIWPVGLRGGVDSRIE